MDSSNRRHQLTLLLVVWSVLNSIASANASDEIIISLHNRVAIIDNEVPLGQIADISGGTADSKSNISALVVGSSPPPGQTINMHPTLIEQKLKQNGFDPDSYQLIAAGPVDLGRKYDTIMPEQIKAAVGEFIESQAPWPPGRRVRQKKPSVPREARLPTTSQPAACAR